MLDKIKEYDNIGLKKGSNKADPIAQKVNDMKLIQIDNYILNHKGEVWCMMMNECIYSSTYEDALEFLKNITE